MLQSESKNWNIYPVEKDENQYGDQEKFKSVIWNAN